MIFLTFSIRKFISVQVSKVNKDIIAYINTYELRSIGMSKERIIERALKLGVKIENFNLCLFL